MQLTFPAPHAEIFTTTFQVTVGGCIVTSYALTGCTSLAAYTILDPARTDSCITIIQVPACGYDSTVSLTGIPNTIIAGSVSSTTIMKLKTYTSDKSLAATYTFTVVATLSGYPYTALSTAPFAVALVVFDPCTTNSIPAKTPPIPTIG